MKRKRREAERQPNSNGSGQDGGVASPMLYEGYPLLHLLGLNSVARSAERWCEGLERKTRIKGVVRALPLLLLSIPASADAGGPILWVVAGAAWFGIAQILVVITEFACLAFSIRTLSKKRLVLWVVIANTVSGALGFIILCGFSVHWLSHHYSKLYVLVPWFIGTYFLSVYTEWLVLKWLFATTRVPPSDHLLRLVAICNAASYVCLASPVAFVLAKAYS